MNATTHQEKTNNQWLKSITWLKEKSEATLFPAFLTAGYLGASKFLGQTSILPASVQHLTTYAGAPLYGAVAAEIPERVLGLWNYSDFTKFQTAGHVIDLISRIVGVTLFAKGLQGNMIAQQIGMMLLCGDIVIQALLPILDQATQAYHSNKAFDGKDLVSLIMPILLMLGVLSPYMAAVDESMVVQQALFAGALLIMSAQQILASVEKDKSLTQRVGQFVWGSGSLVTSVSVMLASHWGLGRLLPPVPAMMTSGALHMALHSGNYFAKQKLEAEKQPENVYVPIKDMEEGRMTLSTNQ